MKNQLLAGLFLFCVWPLLIAQKSAVWDYPIKPGSSEWENCKSVEERLRLYNIPVSLLASMTTEDLVETCLNYPELRMIFAYNSIQRGYESLRDQFNGFIELEKRNDAGRYLFGVYSRKKHDDVLQITGLVNQGKFMHSILYIETILSQNGIINNMTKSEQTSLKNQAIESFQNIERLKNIYGTYPLQMPALIMGRILMIEKETNMSLKSKIDDEIVSFTNNSESQNVSVWYKIYNIAKGHI